MKELAKKSNWESKKIELFNGQVSEIETNEQAIKY